MSQEPAPAAATPVPFPRTFREAVAQFFGDGRSAHPLIQFVKYGFAGGLATLVNIIAFTLAAWFLFPCFTADDPILTLLHVTPPPVDESSRALYASYANFTGFIVSDVFCYLVNRRFVFVQAYAGFTQQPTVKHVGRSFVIELPRIVFNKTVASREDQILSVLAEHPKGLSRLEIEMRLNLRRSTTQNTLKKLEQSGKIVKQGTNRATVYLLKI